MDRKQEIIDEINRRKLKVKQDKSCGCDTNQTDNGEHDADEIEATNMTETNPDLEKLKGELAVSKSEAEKQAEANAKLSEEIKTTLAELDEAKAKVEEYNKYKEAERANSITLLKDAYKDTFPDDEIAEMSDCEIKRLLKLKPVTTTKTVNTGEAENLDQVKIFNQFNRGVEKRNKDGEWYREGEESYNKIFEEA